ncbi:MAG: glycoside hydrolase family 13 protein [Actinomycetes bacterium]
MSHSLPSRSERPWWRDAVTYQIYIRSFADANGDGKGDVEGIRSKLPYLKKLGIDAIWITPWYPSPQHDHGYDVADYMNIEPDYGTLAQAEQLIREAHELGIKFIVDIVPNHSSDQHAWFQEALRAAPGSAERNRYIFREGKGENGELPPNNWQAVFGGPAWHRVNESDGSAGQWYLHLFAVEQPDLNWENPEVRGHFEEVLKFWLDRGVDGFRIDVAHGMIKEQGLPDITTDPELLKVQKMPYWDQDGVHEIYRAWRKILDSYPGDRMAVAEAWVSPESLPLYLRNDELANSFNFTFLDSKWDRKILKKNIKTSIKNLKGIDAPSSWVFNNHDVTRSVTRFDLGLKGGGVGTIKERFGKTKKFNPERGVKRARAGAMLMLALPGGAYVYQGEELGLPEVVDIPKDRLTDPRWKMSGYTDPGRDGCRVPLPWGSVEAGSFGFSTNSALGSSDSWLPQPSWWGKYGADAQENDPQSTLNIYRKALEIRKSESGLGDGKLKWIDLGKDVLAFSRPGDFLCIVNFGDEMKLPKGAEILHSSSPIEGNKIPTDTTVWLRSSL